MPRTLTIALIPGDGIGTEVVAEAVKVLSAIAPAADLDVRTTEYDLGARRYNATGELLPEAVVEELRGYDAILLGAIGVLGASTLPRLAAFAGIASMGTAFLAISAFTPQTTQASRRHRRL